jgi:two-component system OmpR family response regulator
VQAARNPSMPPDCLVDSLRMAHILIADDDGHIREVVRYALERAGHRVTEAHNGAVALQRFTAEPPDLIVLDILMPEDDGLSVCRQIRARSKVPIIFLSSRDEELDRVLGLELGADDYVTKPFSPRELTARVAAVLRRVTADAAFTEGSRAELLVHGPLAIDLGRHTCTYREQPVTLTVTELELLVALVRAPGRVIERADLVRRAYGEDHHITERTVDSHVRRIRQKLGALGADPIETVYGLGYRMREKLE